MAIEQATKEKLEIIEKIFDRNIIINIEFCKEKTIEGMLYVEYLDGTTEKIKENDLDTFITQLEKNNNK